MIVAVATTVQMLLTSAAWHARPPSGYPSRNVIRQITQAPVYRPGRRQQTAGHPGPPPGATARPAGTVTRGAPSPPACRPGATRPARSQGDWTRTGGDSSV